MRLFRRLRVETFRIEPGDTVLMWASSDSMQQVSFMQSHFSTLFQERFGDEVFVQVLPASVKVSVMRRRRLQTTTGQP